MNDVFISYSRRDKVFVQKLYDCLTSANRTVWADWDSIPAASDWFAEIKQGIEETDSVIFVLSPEWIKSNECRKEMDYAVKMGKRLFPILYIPVDPKDVPPELGKINWVYMRDSDDFDKGFETLCSALDTDLEWIKLHTRIQVRALEWEKKDRSASFALRGEDLTEGEQFVANGANKNPVPTHLQSQYILASRADATKRQRQTLAGVTVALVVSIALAVVAAIQWRESVKQAQIALSRQLVAQAQSINFIRNSKQNIADLLSLQSLKLSPSIDAINVLINNNLSAHQTGLLRYDVPVKHMALSPDGKYVAAAGDCVEPYASENCTSTVVVWEVTAGKKIAQLSHHGAVNSIAFSADGKYVLSGSADNFARLWEVDNGSEILSIPHEDDVISTAFSADDHYVVSGDGAGHVRVWDVASRTEMLHFTLRGARPSASSVAFSPDRKYIAAAGTCDEIDSMGYCTIGIAGVWELATKEEIARVTHDSNITAIAFSPDSKSLLTGGFDNTTRLWKIADSMEVARFVTNGLIESVVFSPDGKSILVTSDPAVSIWEIASKDEISHLTHDGPVFSAVFSPDGRFVVSASEDGTARVWNISNGEEIARMTHDEGDSFSSVYSVGISPDGKFAFSGGADKTIRIWETASVDKAVMMHHHKRDIQVILSRNGDYVFSRDNDDNSCVWEASSGRQINCTSHDIISGPIFSTDGKQMLSAGPDGLFRVRDVSSGTEITLKNQDSFLFVFAFSPDGKHIGAVMGTFICLWDSSTGEQIKCIALAQGDFLHSLALSPDDKNIVTGYSDGRLCIWEISSEKQVRCITHDTAVTSAEFGNDGKSVLFLDSNQNACRWELPSEVITCLYINHDDQVNSIRFSPDGHYVASASDDGSVRIWNADNGEEIARKIHDDIVWSVAFSPDGKYMVSASGDGIVRQWLWQKDDIMADACTRFTRNLTRGEWAQFIGDAMSYEAVCENLPIELEIAETPTSTQ